MLGMPSTTYELNPTSKVKPERNFWQIWNLCFGFIGIQFGFALQNANNSRIFQSLGASIEEIPLLWIAAPITGLLVQPIVGFVSDRTWSQLGRRRPFLLAGAILACISLILMPNSPELWAAAAMLWMLDAALNISLGPSIALVGDTLPKNQLPAGFSMQSVFIGLSAVIASCLPWTLSNVFNIQNTAPEGQLPPTVIYSYYIGGFMVLATVFWTARSTGEYSAEEIQRFDAEHSAEHSKPYTKLPPQFFLKRGCILVLLGALLLLGIHYFSLHKNLYILAFSFIGLGLCKFIAAIFSHHKKIENAIYTIVYDISTMPRIMRRLALVQSLSWFALFTLWMYGTSAVTSYHFGTTDAASEQYNEGANWVGILFGAYNFFAALAAIGLPFLVTKIGGVRTHALSLSLGGISLAAFLWIPNPLYLLIPMVGLGIGWASMLTLPFAILTSHLPSSKLGTYAGLFNIFIVLPQLLATSILVILLNTFFSNQPIYSMLIAGGSMLMAAVATLFVRADADN